MATPLSISGWTSNVIKGGSVHASSPVNTAQSLASTPSGVSDSALASRRYVNPLTGKRKVATAASIYKQADVPAYLTQAVNDLNAQQTAAKTNLTSWQNKLVDLYNKGGDNSYLITEALRAASVQPGTHVGFGAAVENPKYGTGYVTQANAAAENASAKTSTISKVSGLQGNLANLQEQRRLAGNSGFGLYWGSTQQKLDQQIDALEAQIKSASGIATAAAGSNTGWVSTPNSGSSSGGGSYGGISGGGLSLPTR